METARRTLIVDRNTAGHRARGVQTWSKILGGSPYFLSENIGNVRTLGKWPDSVLLQTADEYPLQAFVIAAIRWMLGLVTVATIQRPTHLAKNFRQRLRRWFFFSIARLIPNLTVVSIAPRIGPSGVTETMPWIYDPEWWDLAADDIHAAAGGTPMLPQNHLPTILFTGALAQMKGFAFYVELTLALTGKFNFVAIGRNSDISPALMDAFRTGGGAFVDISPSDHALFASIHDAQFIWCCYRPDFDQSSGIFGRAMQLGSIPLVRQGSWLNHASDMLSYGVAVPYNAPAETVMNILSTQYPRDKNLMTTDMRRHSIETMASLLNVPSVAPVP